MSAFLILCSSGPGRTHDDAFAAGAARLQSRCSGEVRTGANGRVRWAVIAHETEMLDSADRLTIVDTVPFMVEPHHGIADAANVTGVSIDVAGGTATLHRDVFGAKPLAYLVLADAWAVASEAKMLWPFLAGRDVNRVALSDAVNFRWVLGADTLIGAVRQVLAGERVILSLSGPVARDPARVPVFSPDGSRTLEQCTEATDVALRCNLEHASAGGAELSVLISGGIDSSVLAGIAKGTGLPVRGYIVRYEGHANPEYERARSVAEWLRIDTDEVVVTEADVRERLAGLVWRLEQPPRHANNIALEKLFTAIRARDGVVVHGDGAEMMFGLADYHRLRNFARKHQVLTTLCGRGPWPGLERWLSAHRGAITDRIRRVAASNPADFARRFDAIAYTPAARAALETLCRGMNPCPELSALIRDDSVPTHEDLQLFQTLSFLQCSLVRLDRIAAPIGVSVAIPFLSDDVVAIATTLPAHCKERAGNGKPILRDLCSKYLPAEVAQWPKMGFQSPDRAWVLGMREAWRARFAARRDDVLMRLLPRETIETLFSLDDYEAQWFLVTLNALLDQVDDPEAVGSR